MIHIDEIMDAVLDGMDIFETSDLKIENELVGNSLLIDFVDSNEYLEEKAIVKRIKVTVEELEG